MKGAPSLWAGPARASRPLPANSRFHRPCNKAFARSRAHGGLRAGLRLPAVLLLPIAAWACREPGSHDSGPPAGVSPPCWPQATAPVDRAVPIPLVPGSGARVILPRPTDVPGTAGLAVRWRPPTECGCPAPTFELQMDDSCPVPLDPPCAFPSPEVAEAGIQTPYWRVIGDLPVRTTPPLAQRYQWRVRACCEEKCSDWSRSAWFELGRPPNDVDGDGYSDLLVGAPLLKGVVEEEGAVYLFRGSSDGVLDRPDRVFRMPPGAARSHDHFGLSVAVGDFDADGREDLAIGAPRPKALVPPGGSAYVIYGSGRPGVELTAGPWQATAHFGLEVAAAGDVNADGYPDLLVGAPTYRPLAFATGAVFVYLGSATGLSPRPAVILSAPQPQMDGWFGEKACGIGDFDGDGYADVAVAARSHNTTVRRAGTVVVFCGSPEGLRREPCRVLEDPLPQQLGEFGTHVAPAGDPNRDGLADLLIGAEGDVVNGVRSGAVYVFFGTPAGWASSPFLQVPSPHPVENALFGGRVAGSTDFNADGLDDFVVGAMLDGDDDERPGNSFVRLGHCSQPAIDDWSIRTNPWSHDRASFGCWVGSAGDLNGDGYADMVVGAGRQFIEAPTEGALFVYYGSRSGVPEHPSVILYQPDHEENASFGNSTAPAIALTNARFEMP